MDRPGYVYIMASKRNGTIYIGVTSNLPERVFQHRNGQVEGFTKQYGCKIVVWYQPFENLHDARRREVQMKSWRRLWKLREIEDMNPDWKDLYGSLV